MFSTDEVQARLTQFYQTRLADLFVKVTDVQQIQGGWEAWLYAFQLHLSDSSSKSLIMRLYPGNSDGKAGHEFKSMQGLRRLNYPVPNVYDLTVFEESLFGASYFMMDYVDGHLLSDKIIENGRIDVELLTRYCQVMVKLHNLEWKSEFQSPYALNDVYAAIDDYLRTAQSSVQSPPLRDFAPLVEWIAAHRDAVVSSCLSLTHNDFHVRNVMLNKAGDLIVIDWANLRIYDYRYDLAWTLLLMGTFGSRDVSDAILETYQAVQGEAVENLDVFMVMAIANRLSDMVVSIKGSATDRGMRPDAVDAMRQYAFHYRACYKWLREITDLRLTGIETVLDELGQHT